MLLLQGLGLLGDGLCRPLELLDSVPDVALAKGLDGGEIGRCGQLLGRARLLEGCEPAGASAPVPGGRPERGGMRRGPLLIQLIDRK